MVKGLILTFLVLLAVVPFLFGLYTIFIRSNTLFRIIIVAVYTITIAIILLSMAVDILW